MDSRRNDDPELPRDLEHGFRDLFRPNAAERAELDQRIERAARARFASRERIVPSTRRPSFARRWILRAAAVLAVAFGGWMLARNLTSGARTRDVARADRDGNGRVDVLDAFQLAREVESGGVETRWDVDENGRVDGEDARAIARIAVRVRS